MRIRYDPEADVLIFILRDEPPVDAVETLASIRWTSNTALVVVVVSTTCNCASGAVRPTPISPVTRYTTVGVSGLV